MTPQAPVKMSSERHALLHSYSRKFLKNHIKREKIILVSDFHCMVLNYKKKKKNTVSVEFSKEKIRPKNSKCSTIANLV